MRQAPLFTPLDLKSVAPDGTFEGYAALFNREDLGRDVILPGAFTRALATRPPADIKLLYQHDPTEPIGVWEHLAEDSRGLIARGRLLLDIVRAREVLTLMRAGALDGLSIGFRATRARRDPKTHIRRLYEIDLWEISVVTFPMQPDARVNRNFAPPLTTHSSAPPFAGRLPTEREFERWLTQDAGFSRSQARSLIRSGLKGLSRMPDAAETSRPDGPRVAERLRVLARLLSSPPPIC